MSCTGFVKLMRTQDVSELLGYPHCFVLLTVIALRARRTESCGIDGLQPGEALLGDHDNYGMSRQQYRTALSQLARAGFITIKATNKGTIATLVDTRVYDINVETGQPAGQPSSHHQGTTKPPSRNHQTTTNKNEKKGRTEEYKHERPDRDFDKQSSGIGTKITVSEMRKAAGLS
jgi:hypothetical protein